jgi:hypothetical protein
MCASDNAPAAQNAGTNPGADHQYDRVGLSPGRSAPALSQNCGIAIAFNQHWDSKRAPQTAGKRHLFPPG